MTDKNGKSLAVGDSVRTPAGNHARVTAVLASASPVYRASDCEKIDVLVGGKDGDDSDTIIWGS